MNQNPQSNKTWLSSLSIFMDKRSIIMFLLGFSAGIPIFLIFSTLSFWLTEAGVDRGTITLFSWAALGYSFKFIWAPLVDKLPIFGLTKLIGQRRSWLFVSQIMVIVAIVLMAMTNPSPQADYFNSVSNLVIMAIASVFLAFSSATQDIVIDAYRIELTQDSNMQTVLASTYNAGYRIANSVTQLGALLLAASLGTAVGNYIYEAWQTTYLVMAGLMIIGLVTTCCIQEPNVKRAEEQYQVQDYLQLCIIFLISVTLFIMGFYTLGVCLEFAHITITDAILKFLWVVGQFVAGVSLASLGIYVLIRDEILNKKIVTDIWLSPLMEFFGRYGVKVALAILLLIGFYRISDIVAGVMANIFYLDLNFDKEEIGWLSKFFAIWFVILGGFIGGILAQRYNVLKMLFWGAILASSTNLIFIGLVKSGAKIDSVNIQIGHLNQSVSTDEVGKWSIKLKQNQLQEGDILKISAQPKGYQQPLWVQVPIKIYTSMESPSIDIQPLAGQDILYKNQVDKDVVIHGDIFNLPQDAKIQHLNISFLNQTVIEAKIDRQLHWSAVVPGKILSQYQSFDIKMAYQQQGKTLYVIKNHSYQVKPVAQPTSRIQLYAVPAINRVAAENQEIELKGKVIVPYSKVWLILGLIFDNLASGLAGAVFIAFLSSLTNISFTAMQYAIFTSLMLLLPKTIAGYSGTIVDHFGYSVFFGITFLIGIPILFLIIWVEQLLSKE